VRTEGPESRSSSYESPLVLRNPAPALLAMRGVAIKLVRVKTAKYMAVRKDSYIRIKGNEDNASSDSFGIRFRDFVCRRPAGERKVLSQATSDTLECAYVFDEVSVSKLLGMTIPHRTLGRGWHTAVYCHGFRVHPPGSRAESRGERMRRQFPRVDSKVETPGAHHGTGTFLEKSKAPSHPEKIRAGG
jgi:hypothetical protein